MCSSCCRHVMQYVENEDINQVMNWHPGEERKNVKANQDIITVELDITGELGEMGRIFDERVSLTHQGGDQGRKERS